jgi:hypothetical protein
VAAVAIIAAIAAANRGARESDSDTGKAAAPTEQSGPGRRTAEMPPPGATAPAEPTLQPKDDASLAMAEPFNSGRLPAALPQIRGNPDAAAATLAAFIAARDDLSVPALLTAIVSAGFAVRHEDGRLDQVVNPGQGLVFDAWEVAAMAKMFRERRTMPLQQLSADLRLVPALARVPFDTLLVDGIVRHANGSQQLLRFWARLIIELGRRADSPYDLLAQPDPAAVQFDPVQTALILRRLFGDFAAAGQQTAAVSETRQPAPLFALYRARARSAEAVRASWSPQTQSPCTEMGKGDTATALDLAAVLIGTGWGRVLDAINSQGADTLSGYLAIGNTLLAYAKLLMTYASIETEVAMDNPPLVRTTNADAGQRRRLTATVVMNSGGWDRYNCVRTALNIATGLDFSLIGDGPMDGVEITWRVDNPGDPYYSNRTGVTGNRPVVGITTGGPRIQDAGTSAGAVGAGTPVSDPTRSKTDDNGRAHIYLEGAPRIPYLPPPHMPVMKQAIVRTNLKLKGGDVKGDAVDIAGQALGGVGAIATLPVELLFRVPWASVGRATVEIRDWETCERNEWYGTMTSTTRVAKSSVRHGETAAVVIKHESSYSHDAVINVAGRSATGTITSEELVASDQTSGYGRVTHRRASQGNYSGDVKVSVGADPQLATYSVGFERPDLTGTTRSTGTCERPAPYKCQPPTPSARAWDGDGRYLSALSGEIDPKNPTVISDRRTIRSGDIEHTFSVSLQRCR